VTAPTLRLLPFAFCIWSQRLKLQRGVAPLTQPGCVPLAGEFQENWISRGAPFSEARDSGSTRSVAILSFGPQIRALQAQRSNPGKDLRTW
jgi:hypothetical protein